MVTLVFSYAHADEALRNELEKHLSPLKRMGRISTWHDRRIAPGEEFEGQIDRYFSEADIILLLISSDFIASDYCYQIEMSNALQRHERGEAVGVLQGSCRDSRVFYAAIFSVGCSLSGLSVTAPMGCQFRVLLDQRCGF